MIPPRISFRINTVSPLKIGKILCFFLFVLSVTSGCGNSSNKSGKSASQLLVAYQKLSSNQVDYEPFTGLVFIFNPKYIDLIYSGTDYCSSEVIYYHSSSLPTTINETRSIDATAEENPTCLPRGTNFTITKFQEDDTTLYYHLHWGIFDYNLKSSKN